LSDEEDADDEDDDDDKERSEQRHAVGPNGQNSSHHSNRTAPLPSSIGNANGFNHHDLFENWSVSDLRTLAAHTNVGLSSAFDRKSVAALLRFGMLNRPHLERYVAAYEKLIRMTAHALVAKARD
jgi:hypothetical protein